MTNNEKELRCPVGPRRLFMKLKTEGVPPVFVDGTLLEVSCSDCARALRKEGRNVVRVLHRYTFLGQLYETEVIEDN